MPRLRHKSTGVVINVDDATAAAQGADWQPADEDEQPRRKPGRPRKPATATEPAED